MPGGAFFLDGGEILALPRDNGDSRYPYGQDGFNFWACSSGYMYANEGLFSWFLRSAEGQEPRIAFFAGMPVGDGRFDPCPLLPVPVMQTLASEEARRYSVLTPTAAYYFTELAHLRFVVRVFVSEAREICFSLYMQNCTNSAQTFCLSSFINPYLRHQIYESGEDRWFKEVRALQPSGGSGALGPFVIAVNEDKDRHHSITNYGVIRRALKTERPGVLLRHEETASRNQYVGGARGSLHTAAALFAGTFGEAQSICTFVETAVAGDLLDIHLGARESARLDIVMSRVDDLAGVRALTAAPVVPDEIDAALEALLQREESGSSGLKAMIGRATGNIKSAVFGSFIEHLKKQVEFCSLLKGYVQLSENSLIGIRDVFQALEGLAFWRPDAARPKMLEALGFTTPEGRCFRQYSLPSANGDVGRMDLRPFIDQGCWVISCVATYLRVTGDAAFLREPCGYHEIADEAARKVVKSARQDTVLEHLVRIMDFLLRNRDPETACVLALYGDWNDALDGLGISRDPSRAYGTGVSVMATLQVVQNAAEMVEVLEFVDAQKHAALIGRYRAAGQEIAAGLNRYAIVENGKGERRIVHGWGDARAYFVGSFRDPDGVAREGLTSNAFWVLSGLHDGDASMAPVILSAFERLDSKYGFKTFEPFFPPDTPGVGRIGKLPPGTAENGATYVHATMFAIMALFRMGRAREAWEQLYKVLPFTDQHANLSHSPFVMPNAYGFNEEKFIDGQNMNDWQTGSSNVLLKMLIRYVYGFEPAWQGVWIQPAAWLPFDSFDFWISARGTPLHIRFENRGRPREFTVNGQPQPGVADAGMGIDKLWVPWESIARGPVEILVAQ